LEIEIITKIENLGKEICLLNNNPQGDLSYHIIFKNMGPTTYIFKNTWNYCFHLNCNNVNKAEIPSQTMAQLKFGKENNISVSSP
jgi:hypothetical protein